MLVKICARCGTKNPASGVYCLREDCEESLMAVPVTEDAGAPGGAPPAGDAGKPAAPAKAGLKAFRLCPRCGRRVRANTYRCECGESLYGIPLAAGEKAESPARQARNGVSYMLRSEDGRLEIPVPPEGECVVGREGAGADYLANRLYVSRRHLSLRREDGLVTVTDAGSKNCTLLNGVSLEPGKPCRIAEGDLLSLGAREGQGMTENAAYLRLMKQER